MFSAWLNRVKKHTFPNRTKSKWVSRPKWHPQNIKLGKDISNHHSSLKAKTNISYSLTESLPVEIHQWKFTSSLACQLQPMYVDNEMSCRIEPPKVTAKHDGEQLAESTEDANNLICDRFLTVSAAFGDQLWIKVLYMFRENILQIRSLYIGSHQCKTCVLTVSTVSVKGERGGLPDPMYDNFSRTYCWNVWKDPIRALRKKFY